MTGEEARQDARYLLPNAHKTNLVWTVNFRELIHVCSVRLCARAQWEIRGVMEQIVESLSGEGASDDHQFLAAFLQPKCYSLGYCPEGERGCGERPTKEEVLSAWKKAKEQELASAQDSELPDPFRNPTDWKEAATVYLARTVSNVTAKMIASYVEEALDLGEAFSTTYKELLEDFFAYAAAVKEQEELIP